MFRSLKNALLRDRSLFAHDKAGLPPHICDHMARDIGMSPTDIERHRFKWPSQSADRPLL